MISNKKKVFAVLSLISHKMRRKPLSIGCSAMRDAMRDGLNNNR